MEPSKKTSVVFLIVSFVLILCGALLASFRHIFVKWDYFPMTVTTIIMGVVSFIIAIFTIPEGDSNDD